MEETPTNNRIFPVSIEKEMKTAYIDYSMSVIVSRALPDVRDGLKPVHRRVLYGMLELGLSASKPFKKSARIVGEVLGKFHPHGDSSVYDTMTRMAQEWSLRYPLVHGQGNFGSIDGDNPAAMRYTEAKLKPIAEEMLADINKNTINYQLNFDDSLKEPTVLPAKIPNLLLNGASGIAVGMATNIPPHNLSNVVDACIAYIDDKQIEITQLIEIIQAPDFPTGGIIYGYTGVQEAYLTGRGRIVIRGKAEIEEKNNKTSIIVSEIPFQVNKSVMIIKTSELIQNKKIEGINDIRDESDRKGTRVVYELKKDSNPSIVLNNLLKHTPLQSSFNVNCIALVKNRPETLNLKQVITYYVEHRLEVLIRKTRFDLEDCKKKAHVLEGLLKAIDYIDEVIKLIKNSDSPEDAKNSLMDKYTLSEIQSKAILDMTLKRLTGLERDKIKVDYDILIEKIKELESILVDEPKRMNILKEDLIYIKEKFGDQRRTKIEYTDDEFDDEDFIEDEEMMISISSQGYIKRTSSESYKIQARGGKGSIGSKSKDDDFISHILIGSNHNYLLVFTDRGKCYWLKVYKIPEMAKTSKGRAIQNLILLEKGEQVMAYVIVKNLTQEEYLKNNNVILATKKGIVKKTTLSSFSKPRVNGIRAIKINQGDELLQALLTSGNAEIMLASYNGKAVRYPEKYSRPVGRNSIGSRGIRLKDEKDFTVGMVKIDSSNQETVLVVTQKGYGKRTKADDYRLTARGARGVNTIKVSEKIGKLVAILSVTDNDHLMIMTKKGITIRMPVASIRVMGRSTQGVKLIKINAGDSIASITKILQD